MKKLTFLLLVLLLCSVSLFAGYGKFNVLHDDEAGLIRLKMESIDTPGGYETIEFLFDYTNNSWDAFMDFSTYFDDVTEMNFSFQIGSGTNSNVYTFTKKDMTKQGFLVFDADFIEDLWRKGEIRMILNFTAFDTSMTIKCKYEENSTQEFFNAFKDEFERMQNFNNSIWNF